MNARTTENIPAFSEAKGSTRAAYAHGKVNEQCVEMLLDSGASCSVVHKDYVSPRDMDPVGLVKLLNADGRSLTPVGTTSLKVNLGNLTAHQTFIVEEHLSAPVILGCDFLTKQGLVMDFEQGTFHSKEYPDRGGRLQLQTMCMLALDEEYPQAIPAKAKDDGQAELEMPTEYHPALKPVLKEYEVLFKQELGQTNVAEHVIDTGDALPTRVPPRPIPFHFAERVQNQLQEMAQEGIIRPSNSPWCAPAVYVPKRNGEIRICVDFVQLNKATKKDSYPVPRADGPQLKLANKKVFSKIDLKSAYWQFPMSEQSIEKTAFCPGPGYGLWEFTRMPYGLTGATQTCQRGLDQVLNDCKDCVDNYVDDLIIFSDDMKSHITDLRRVLSRIRKTNFTLRGSKCFLGRDTTSHLGFEYSCGGVAPCEEKTRAVADWPTPTSAKDVRAFLGLVNFYWRFIPKFADIAAPLTELTGRAVVFRWEDEQKKAFEALKGALTSPPILDYPRHTDEFILTTDASDLGLGAVLSTRRGTVVEYASRTLTSAEKNYATIEKECLAIVWAVRKYRHYLIGARFTLETDHKPLEWLESVKPSRAHSQRIERWSLELRAYEFNLVHRPGNTNQNADALSRKPVSLVVQLPALEKADITQVQRQDPVLTVVIEQLRKGTLPPNTQDWMKFPLRHFKQMWSQLIVHDSILCRKVKSPTMAEHRLLIVVPHSQRKLFLTLAHDDSGHQGMDRTMARVSEMAYWVGMGRDVADHCGRCVKCQITKAPRNKPAPLQPVIARKPWEMVAVDILKVPRSIQGNQYILVAQDYFSKWPFARAIPDQKADRIVDILRDDVFTLVGPPQKLHSDQGRNFESRILGDLCRAFGVKKSRTTPYHPMGDGLVERMNRSLLSLLHAFVEKEDSWEEHLQLLLFAYRTTKHSTTGLSPFEVLFGSNPPSLQIPDLTTSVIPEPCEYSQCLKRKLLELREMVEANIVESAERQQQSYEGCESRATLEVGQQVLLDNPTKGKLDPRWTGPWTVRALRGPSTVQLRMGTMERAVHINRVRPLLTDSSEDRTEPVAADCEPDNPTMETASEFQGCSAEAQASSPAIPEAAQPQATPPQGTTVTTRRGRTVKPVQYYGHT